MENSENNVLSENTFINREINNYLMITSKWGNFLAIVGYIGMGLLILVGILMMVGMSFMNNYSHTGSEFWLIGLLYILLAVVYYFPVTYLYKFSIQIKNGLSQKDQSVLTSGFLNLKSLLKFMGILTIVFLSLYPLAIIIMILVIK